MKIVNSPRERNRLLAEKRKIAEGRRRGSISMARKHQGEHEAIRGIINKARELNPNLSRARLIKLVLEKIREGRT